MVRAAHAPAQLVQLGQPEAVGAVDHDGVGGRHVDSALDDRGADQHVVALAVEIEHHRFQLALAHLPVGDRDAGVRHQLLHLAGDFLDVPHLVVQEEHLSAALQFAQQRLAQYAAVPLGNQGLDRHPPGRRGGDDRKVADAGHGHVKRARDRRGGQRQQVDLGA